MLGLGDEARLGDQKRERAALLVFVSARAGRGKVYIPRRADAREGRDGGVGAAAVVESEKMRGVSEIVRVLVIVGSGVGLLSEKWVFVYLGSESEVECQADSGFGGEPKKSPALGVAGGVGPSIFRACCLARYSVAAPIGAAEPSPHSPNPVGTPKAPLPTKSFNEPQAHEACEATMARSETISSFMTCTRLVSRSFSVARCCALDSSCSCHSFFLARDLHAAIRLRSRNWRRLSSSLSNVIDDAAPVASVGRRGGPALALLASLAEGEPATTTWIESSALALPFALTLDREPVERAFELADAGVATIFGAGALAEPIIPNAPAEEENAVTEPGTGAGTAAKADGLVQDGSCVDVAGTGIEAGGGEVVPAPPCMRWRNSAMTARARTGASVCAA